MAFQELPKHVKYKNQYKSNELFWGLGIEEETYFQWSKPIYVAAPILRTAHRPERYSVAYFSNYKIYQPSINSLFPDASGFIALPFFFNSHAFQRMDRHGQHVTTYEKVPKPNPKFLGKTFFQELQEFSPAIFRNGFEQWFVFDGDTIEFMTLNFYKTTVLKCIQELLLHKTTFLRETNRFLLASRAHCEKGLLMYPPRNPGFVVHCTNPRNISMFNNGTYHINITLPSYLNSNGHLAYPDKFREDHRRFIRLLQWLEPLLLACYGTPDPLCFAQSEASAASLYSRASQRAAVSRYIGIGTFNTLTMPEGKWNTLPRSDVRGSDLDFWWYTQYHATSGYTMLNEIGMDINFRKHYNHGVEFRCFDWFPEHLLHSILSFFVNIGDYALQMWSTPPEAVLSEAWNTCVIGVLREGQSFNMSTELLATYEKVFGTPLLGLVNCSVKGVMEVLRVDFASRFRGGLCARLMLDSKFINPSPKN